MELDFAKMDGLLPAVVQDATTREVLMVGFMNEAAWEKTLRTGHVTFWSRTRNTLWTKGETSGHFLNVRRIRTDCDQDTVLVEAEPVGPTCHTGAYSCFFTDVQVAGAGEDAKGGASRA
jgi:phosphoribosyl-ATP pyrophosphohydrolase/phosphoribosyl-AMP cyclohydrolase